MGLRVDASGGIVLLSAAPFDATIVDHIRALPDRRYQHKSQAWIIPARRDHLLALSRMIAELEELDIVIELLPEAAARLRRAAIARLSLRDGAITINGPYSPERVAALRRVPERHFDPQTRTWTVPVTRAGALALLALTDDDDGLVITDRARAALMRAAPGSPASLSPSGDAAGPSRRSPTPHWRHFTSGPVFNNPARERVHVPGIGLCVRVRVRPHSSRSDIA